MGIFNFLQNQKDSAGINLADNWFKNPRIYAEKILKSPAVCASITMPVQSLSSDGQSVNTQTVSIPFFMEDNFSIGDLSNKWSSLQSMDSLEQFSQMINAFAGSATGNAHVSIQSEAMSLKTWKGSDFRGFTLNCLFISTSRSVVPPEIIKTLCTSALPMKLKGNEGVAGLEVLNKLKNDLGDSVLNAAQNAANWFIDNMADGSQSMKDAVSKGKETAKYLLDDVGMVAPLYYGYDLTNSENRGANKGSTLSFQVGDWFRATDLVVESISGIQFSKEVIAPPSHVGQNKKAGDLYDNSPTNGQENRYGYPLWGKCSINLQPTSMMTKEKFESYFLDKAHSNNSVIDQVKTSLLSGDIGGIANLFNLPS